MFGRKSWSAADNTYRYSCNTNLPDFTFGIRNGTFIIPSTYMPYQRDQAGTTCISIITGDNSTDSNHEYTFGTWWSQLGVLILDYGNSQVGVMNKSSPLPIFLPLFSQGFAIECSPMIIITFSFRSSETNFAALLLCISSVLPYSSLLIPMHCNKLLFKLGEEFFC